MINKALVKFKHLPTQPCVACVQETQKQAIQYWVLIGEQKQIRYYLKKYTFNSY